MANTGNGGADQMVTDNRAMAADSVRSIKRGKPHTSTTGGQKPVSPEHALEMLASAVNYLRGAGMTVIAGNSVSNPGGVILVVAVHGAKYQHGAFVLANAGGDDDAAAS